ncbi:TetR/AcrR family transcriptional regulator [Candidatus Bipolaricaulota bacterium]|nr:TetR/AcrR family transcriptional regulator [Candidatus Bipolaricaulota bacterium]
MSEPAVLERIVEAGKKLFARQGFHATGMRDIAKLAQVSIGSLYHYFRSKDELFLAVVRRALEERLVQARELLKQGLPGPAILQEVLTTYFSGLAEEPETAQLLSRVWAPEDPALWKKLGALLEEYAQAIAEILAEASRTGAIRPVHPLLTAYALLGMAGAITLRATQKDAVAEEFRRLGAKELAELAWHALRP